MNKINNSNNTLNISEKLLKLLKQAYAPYSKVKVSAILITADNNLYSGVNIENATLTPGICAERCAIFKAISETTAPYKIQELHLLASTKKPLFPCGVCLQVMSEFFNKNTKIFVYDLNGKLAKQLNLKDLLPFAVNPSSFDQEPK